MISPVEQFAIALKQSNNSLTSARREVFGAMLTEEPLGMNELVGKLDGKVNRASIYRVVALFEQLGIIIRLQIGWKYKLELSDSFSYHHHHATCLQCGQVVALPENEMLEQKIQFLALTNGFVIQDHQLEIRGLCTKCHKAKDLLQNKPWS